jgi:hypothetical protein
VAEGAHLHIFDVANISSVRLPSKPQRHKAQSKIMTHAQIKQAAHRRPFRPFTLRLDRWAKPLAWTPRNALASIDTKETVVIFATDGTDRIVDVVLVTELQSRRLIGYDLTADERPWATIRGALSFMVVHVVHPRLNTVPMPKSGRVL